jgi:predicted negative regulator of RcsB-dependent stress response
MWTQLKAAKFWIVVGLLVAWSAFVWCSGYQWSRARSASRASSVLSKQLDQVLDEQAQDRKRAEKLQESLDKLPRSQGKVRDAVRQAPSNCVLPPAVADSLREAIDSANRARALPAHP